MMNCAEFEILLCDAIDGTLKPVERAAFEAHQRQCSACAELAGDASAAVAFMGRAADIETPPELLTRLTFHIPRGQSEARTLRAGLAGWFRPVLQPRFAMGMAMTILSFSMLGRFTGIEVRQLKPSDLDPTKVLAVMDDKAHRTWARAVKYYESLRLVYEMQTRLQEWTQQEDEEDRKSRPAEASVVGNAAASGSKEGSR